MDARRASPQRIAVMNICFGRATIVPVGLAPLARPAVAPDKL
jgi:hypothetical protein